MTSGHSPRRTVTAAAVLIFGFLGVAEAMPPDPPDPGPDPGPGRVMSAGQATGLSLEEAIARAFRNHPDIRINELSVALAGTDIKGAHAEFDPRFTGSVNYRESDTPTDQFINGDNILGTAKSRNLNWSASVNQRYFTGTAASLDFSLGRDKGSVVIQNINFGSRAEIRPRLGLSLQQPLLRGISWDANLANVRLAEMGEEMSRLDFQTLVETIIAEVETAYWQMVGARQTLAVVEKALESAEAVLRISEERFKVGDVAELEVITAQSEVATQEEAIIRTRNDLENARDALAKLVLPVGPGQVGREEFVPTDEPRVEEIEVDEEASIRRAQDGRPDLKRTLKQLQQAQIQLDKARHELLPSLNLTGGLGTSGLGKDTGNALAVMMDRDFIDWSVGLALEVPLGGNRAAEAARDRARITKMQAEITLRKLERDIAYEIRTATRAVQTGRESMRASEAARVLAEKRLDVERAKLEQGAAIARDVLEAERALLDSRSREIQARIGYRLAILRLRQAESTLLKEYEIELELDGR